MWYDYLMDLQQLKAIYGDRLPTLQGVALREIRIVNGLDLDFILKIDLPSLPDKMPEKWIARQVNRVSIEICLSGANIISLTSAGGDIVGNFDIQQEGELKKIGFEVAGRNIFEVRSKWIRLSAIHGYWESFIANEP